MTSASAAAAAGTIANCSDDRCRKHAVATPRVVPMDREKKQQRNEWARLDSCQLQWSFRNNDCLLHCAAEEVETLIKAIAHRLDRRRRRKADFRPLGDVGGRNAGVILRSTADEIRTAC
jgi:hypothetical protein